jgi:hypothetical protein
MNDDCLLVVYNVKCDAPGCDYTFVAEKFEDYEVCINRPCPKCGAILLTQADWDAFKHLRKLTKEVNIPMEINKINDKLFDGKKCAIKITSNGSGKLGFGKLEIL